MPKNKMWLGSGLSEFQCKRSPEAATRVGMFAGKRLRHTPKPGHFFHALCLVAIILLTHKTPLNIVRLIKRKFLSINN